MDGFRFDDRLVWVECFGIPPHLWCRETFKNIESIWGPVVDFDRHIEEMRCLTYARIFVRTKLRKQINCTIRLQSNMGGRY